MSDNCCVDRYFLSNRSSFFHYQWQNINLKPIMGSNFFSYKLMLPQMKLNYKNMYWMKKMRMAW